MSLAETLRARVRQKRPRIVASAKEWRELRRRLWERSGGKCEECRSRAATDAAHIKARSAGGDDVLLNLRALCRVCHSREHGITIIAPYTTLSEIRRRAK